MNKREAHEFLDAVRSGVQAQQWEITDALFVTGDLTKHKLPAANLQRVASPQWPYYATLDGSQPQGLSS